MNRKELTLNDFFAEEEKYNEPVRDIAMNRKELTEKYNELVRDIASIQMFDGRGKGIDVYICDQCGARFYTRYVDKGVTPFVIACRVCKHGDSVHRDTIGGAEWISLAFQGETCHSWVRPTLEQFLRLSPGAQEHVLQGGLMLKEELK